MFHQQNLFNLAPRAILIDLLQTLKFLPLSCIEQVTYQGDLNSGSEVDLVIGKTLKFSLQLTSLVKVLNKSC